MRIARRLLLLPDWPNGMPGDDNGEVTVSTKPFNSDRRLGDGYNSSEEWGVVRVDAVRAPHQRYPARDL